MTVLDHPDDLERLRAERSLLPKAISEILRFGFGGPGGLPRYAARDFELRGKEIKKGQMLMLSFAGAGRDPAVYRDPDTFDIDRDPKELLSFGSGPHFCMQAFKHKGRIRYAFFIHRFIKYGIANHRHKGARNAMAGAVEDSEQNFILGLITEPVKIA